MILRALKRFISARLLAPIGPVWLMPWACHSCGLVGFLASFLVLNIVTCHAAGFPTPSGKFTFEGKRYAGTITPTDTIITNNSLYLTGDYKWPPVAFRPLVFDYRRFTVVVKLRPEIISHGVTLLAGGTACRWFVVNADIGR